MNNIYQTYLFCFFIVVLSVGNLSAQSETKNYIHIEEPIIALPILGGNNGSVESIQYFDGLGRPNQSISIKATPDGKDLVVPIEYDAVGRQLREYLPVPVSSSNGAFVEEIDGAYYQSKHQTPIWYAERAVENSPLNRIFKQGAPGTDWALGNGHEIEYGYGTNKNTEVVRYKIILGNIQQQGHYPAHSLYKHAVSDENGSMAIEFKDKQGRLVLKRNLTSGNSTISNGQILDAPQAEYVDTYYVYDIHNNLMAVIPPLAAKESSMSLAVQNKFCYLYQYDQRNRMISKKIPGKEREYMVYDRQDRLVATQDANLREENKWLFFKYDKFGRMVYTGVMTGADRNSVQTLAYSFNQNNEERRILGFAKNGNTVFYSKTAFPTNFSEVLTVNYYDSYANLGFTVPSDILGETQLRKLSKETKSMATASHVRILGTNQWEKTYMVYDRKSRLVGTYKNNHLGGYTYVENKLNFKSLPTETRTRHRRSSDGDLLEIEENFVYDNMLRLFSQVHSVNGAFREYIFHNEYDELGQLISKNVGASEFNNTSRAHLQQIDYKYNIRGWLTDINDVSNLNPPHKTQNFFAFKVNYNDISSNPNLPDVEPLYNGNISRTSWRTASDNIQRSYGYAYDPLNRLLDAHYYIPYSSVVGSYNEHLTYDDNGNILSLKRNGLEETEQQTFEIDDLAYEYDGNQLKNVSDATNYSEGFDDGNKHAQTGQNDYEYDANGNMTKDRNKDIVQISYNHLNLPTEVKFGNNDKIEYIYTATGEKIQKKVKKGNQTETTDYLDGFQYFDDELGFFPHSEGYVKVTNSLLGVFYNYVYNYTDHLGNIRLRYTRDPLIPTNVRILEEDHYYPFGLKHEGYNSEQHVIIPPFRPNPLYPTEIIPITPAFGEVYKYKFNGKELQDELSLNWYDYDARNYDAAIGRWMNVDPLAEETMQPYSYANNNPIIFIDPDGRIPYPITIRAFAPFKSFGLGFHGDNRGYSTGNVSARVHQKINFDTDKTSITTNAWSSPSWHAVNPNYKKTATPSVNFEGDFTIQKSGNAKTFSFGTHVAGGNPLTPGAPPIDVFSNFSITENKKAGTLDISGKLTGDNFPSTEAFITDPNGNNVFIGIGFYEGSPFSSLWGENKDNPITNFNFSITTDGDGNFTGINAAGKNYSISDWNKMFETADPHKNANKKSEQTPGERWGRPFE